MKFEAMKLRRELLANIAAMGFRRPTDIQYKAIGPVLAGDDVLAVAQTGTGKTAAFVIPILQKLLSSARPDGYVGVRVVIMEPTHELAHQVQNVVEDLADGTGITSLAIYGGVAQEPQIQQLKRGTDIIVATPGRLFDLAAQGHLTINQCEILVLDEADHMLDLGFIDDIRQLVRRLPRRRQTLFFSATIDEKIKKLAYSLVIKPVHIRISPKNMVSRNVTHSLLRIAMEEKRFYLERIYAENPEARIIVFVRTRLRAERVLGAMQRVNIQAVNIHGDKSQGERSTALDDFRVGKVRMLIATDISARGIDLPSVHYVVNYDVPDVVENYVHRVGRTGRGMDKGFAVTFCAAEEEELLAKVEEYLGGKIDEIQMNRADRDATLDFSRDAAYDWKKLVGEEIYREEHASKPAKKKK